MRRIGKGREKRESKKEKDREKVKEGDERGKEKRKKRVGKGEEWRGKAGRSPANETPA